MKVRLQYSALAGLLLVFGCASLGAQRNAVEGSFQRTLTVSGVVDLDVSTGSGRIEIREGTGDRVQIAATIRVGERDRGRDRAERLVREVEANPPVEQNGNVIRIGRLNNPELQRYVSISYDIVVPGRARVRSNTGSGSQTVVGVDGPVDVETGSGSIELRNIPGDVTARTGSGSIVADMVGGAFAANTGSGRITATLGGAGKVDATTGSGSIQINGVKGALRASSGSGGITVGGEPTGNWDVSTSSGSIVVRLPQNAAFDLSAHTGSGGIHLDHPLTVQGRIGRRKDVVGKVRGGGFALDLRTSSGSIRIE
jgi:hypothetical protein